MPHRLTGSQKRHRATRGHHALETAEDYTELIAELIKEGGEARIRDIAGHLGISHVTAIKTVRRLASNGYVRQQKHQPVLLTKKGVALARNSFERHKLLLDFLIRIGVPKKIAEIDVEGIEHHVSKSTLKVIARFVRESVKT